MILTSHRTSGMSLLPHADSLGIATQIGRRPVDEVYNPFFLGDLPNDNLLAQPECPNGRQAATDVFIGGACPDETTPTGGAQYPSVCDRIPGSTIEFTRNPPLNANPFESNILNVLGIGDGTSNAYSIRLRRRSRTAATGNKPSGACLQETWKVEEIANLRSSFMAQIRRGRKHEHLAPSAVRAELARSTRKEGLSVERTLKTVPLDVDLHISCRKGLGQ